MRSVTRRSLAAVLAWVSLGAAAWDASRFAWYDSDAGGSFASALPIGNGRLGAAVFGSATEKLVLNENSVWSGPWQDRVNANSARAVPDIRKKLQAGDITGAGQSAMNNMIGAQQSPRAYNPLVNLAMDFGHSSTGISAYTRWLDTYQGTATVTYMYGGVNYSREYVASYPHGVLAFRLSASEGGKVNVKLSLSRGQFVLTQGAKVNSQNESAGHGVTMSANSGQSSGAITFWSEARAVNLGGKATSDGKTLSITGADTVDIFFNAETTYRYSDQAAAQAELTRKLDAAAAAGYPAVRNSSITDFAGLMGRVNLDLGSSGQAGNQPVPKRLSNYKKSANADPQLVTLMFNFGRHLLAASSRDTGSRSLPANLQGLWNQDFKPPWQSKYTVNINLEMNYWPALVTNLAETQKPVFDLINVAIPRGKAVAKAMYGCNDGFVIHHNTDLWGDAAPVDKGTPYSIWPMGQAWLSSDVMEHYRWTQNKTFLQQTGWPILQQAARFAFCSLFDWKGHWTAGPSLSPEHGFTVPSGMTQAGKSEGIDISVEMDNQLLHQLFANVVETCAALNLTDADCAQAADYLPKIQLPRISPKTGRIQEWREDYAEGEAGHRHFSPLWGLYPGKQLTPLMADGASYAKAAGALLDHRMASGSGSTGWSRTWAINLYARLLQGDKVWSNIAAFIQRYPTANLWNTGEGGVFQIDGNFGLTAGVAEMLLQSHADGGGGDAGDVVHLLPALPAAVPAGSASGLVARGNFVVEEMQWADRALVAARIRARSGGRLAVRVQEGKGFTVNGKPYTGPMDTAVGSVYEIAIGGGQASKNT